MEHRARKRFGQNFLHDPGVIQRIVDAIHPQPGQHLVEIGPGKGALTRPLLARLGSLDVVELDRDLVPILERQCGYHTGLRIHNADALRFDFRTLAGDGPPLRVVGNLPYNISTPLLFHLIKQADAIADMHFMLQKEVVERLAAEPASRDYGRLSVMVQYRCAVENLFTVRSGAFVPAPKVDSAVVRLVPHAQPPVAVDDETDLEHLVAQAFSHRRKTIRNSLKGLLEGAEIEALGVDPGLRPEVLSLEDFARLSNGLSTKKTAAPSGSLPDSG